jgi:hypothetical protein
MPPPAILLVTAAWRCGADNSEILEEIFFGNRCPHLGVEGLVNGLERDLQHYCCPTGVWKKLKIAMKFLLIEIGLLLQPFTRYMTSFVSSNKLQAEVFMGESQQVLLPLMLNNNMPISTGWRWWAYGTIMLSGKFG